MDIINFFRHAENGNIRGCKFAIDNGIDVNVCYDGVTALYLASHDGHVNCVKFLIDNGANINQQDDTGSTPLMVAIDNYHFECIKFLLKNKALVNIKDNYGKTALYYAIQSGCREYVRILLRYGADIFIEDNKGRSPSEFAEKILQKLQEHTEETLELRLGQDIDEEEFQENLDEELRNNSMFTEIIKIINIIKN